MNGIVPFWGGGEFGRHSFFRRKGQVASEFNLNFIRARHDFIGGFSGNYLSEKCNKILISALSWFVYRSQANWNWQDRRFCKTLLIIFPLDGCFSLLGRHVQYVLLSAWYFTNFKSLLNILVPFTPN